jgi:hypothetical protein
MLAREGRHGHARVGCSPSTMSVTDLIAMSGAPSSCAVYAMAAPSMSFTAASFALRIGSSVGEQSSELPVDTTPTWVRTTQRHTQ